MMTKARDKGLDWTHQLPLVLAALQRAPNRDIGLSPHQIVYGETVEVLWNWFIGWREDRECFGVYSWVEN